MDYREQVLGCFLGKTIGGTLGARYEGRNGYLYLTGYDPVPSGAVPNDDLDLQLVWLAMLKETGLEFGYPELGRSWLEHIDFHADEYGVAIANLKKGILPPYSGLHNNFFTSGIGGAIRTEIWSCVAAGDPAVAAAWAELDSSVDHYGDGVTGAVFFALLESHLFQSGSLRESIDFARRNLPECKFRRMVEDAVICFDSGRSYESARDFLAGKYRSANFTDINLNGGFIMLGLLYGEGEFKRSVLYAVNCGQDTDCTGATVGAILGILLGAGGIEPELAAPIGERIVVGDYIRNLQYPETLSELVREIVALHEQLPSRKRSAMALPYRPAALTDFSEEIPWRLNGVPRKLPGTILNLRELSRDPYREISLETTVSSSTGIDAYFLLCARGLNSIYLDGCKVAQFGNYGEMIPGFHRAAGGILIPLPLRKETPRTLRVNIFTHNLEVEPHAYYGFCDSNFRHCAELKFA